MAKHVILKQRKTETPQLKKTPFWKILTPQARIARVELKIVELKKLHKWLEKDVRDYSQDRKSSTKRRKVDINFKIGEIERKIKIVGAELKAQQDKLERLKQKFAVK